MNDSFILRVALACSFIGIFALFMIFRLTDVEDAGTAYIDGMGEDEHLVIKGTVERISGNGNITIITLSRTEFVDVVVYGAAEGLSKGDFLEAEGVLKEYKGEMELIADYISKPI